MFSSLRVRLIVAFLFISLLGLVVAAVVSRILTASAFDRFRAEAQSSEFVDWAAEYYAERGTLDGFDAYLRSPEGPRPQMAPPPGQQGQGGAGGGNPPGAAQGGGRFFLVGMDGVALSNGAGFRMGTVVPEDALELGAPVVVDGQRVGTVVDTQRPEINRPQLEFLARTDQALFIAAGIAAVVALLAGVLLARGLSQPLMTISHALKAVGQEVEPPPLDEKFRGEIGELVRAFNRMSADLARSNSLRRQMTADIAHELRSPLAVINGYLEGMRDGSLPPTKERYEAIYEETQQLRLLIDDLRTLSLADAGELTLRFENAHPSELLADIQRSFMVKAKQAGVKLQVEAAPDLPAVRVDRARIIQVLTNLLNNALRYTPEDGTITVEAARQGSNIALRVKDTGKGIPADKLPNLFQRFYRVEDDREQVEGQTGIGLAIVKALVEMHGGSVRAESEGLGRGAQFSVMLPATA